MACTVVTTTGNFRHKGKPVPGVPLIQDGTRFLEPACAYLRWLVFKGRCKPSSATTYAFQLAPFFEYIKTRMADGSDTFGEVDTLEQAIAQVRDEHLEEYLNELEVRERLHNTILACRDTIFNFYAWMELHGFVQEHVRLPGVTEAFTPKLTSREVITGDRRRRSKFGVASLIRVDGKKSRPRPTPTSEQISLLYEQATKAKSEDIQDRNLLLLDWYHEMGVRRIEWKHLLLEQVPSQTQLEEMDQSEAVEFVLMVTKGSRIGVLQVMPHLLLRTREYIDSARQRIVERFKAKDSAYKEPAEIFLSNKTGLPLVETSISNILRAWFKAADVPGSGHRIRATHLQGLIDAELEAEEAAIISSGGTKVFVDERAVVMRVMERARHQDEDSLKAYVKRRMKSRYKNYDRDTMVTLEMGIKARTQEVAALDAKIARRKKELEQLEEARANAAPRQRGHPAAVSRVWDTETF